MALVHRPTHSTMLCNIRGTAADTKQPNSFVPWYILAASAPASELTVSLFGAAER